MSDSHMLRNTGDKLYIGSGETRYVTWDGTDLTFTDGNAGTKTLSQLAAAGSTTLDAAFDNGKLIDSSTATGAANAFSVGAAGADEKIEIFHDTSDGTINCRTGDLTITAAGGDVSLGDENLTTTGIIEGTGGIGITADDVNLTLGASGATDSKIFYDDTNGLTFYDQIHGSNVTLSDMAGSNLNSPTVLGDMSISDGKVTQVDSDDETAYLLTSSSTTNDINRVVSGTLTTGTAFAAHLAEGVLNGGFYFRAYDTTGAANVATIGENGATVLAGSAAGTDVLTLTAGDLTLTAGDVVLTDGTITGTTSTGTDGSKISKNVADATNPTLEVEQDHASGGLALLVDQDATGDVNAISVENAGTGYAVTTTAGAAGGEGFEYIAAGSGTGVAFRGDGSTGSWIGANDVGMVDIDTDGALAAGANLLRLECTGANAQDSFVCEILSSGNIAGATDGALLNVVESGAAQATTYAVRISSTNNEALHVDTGLSLFDERVTITLADNTGPALAITNPDTTGNTNAVTITPSGSGAGLLITPQETDTQGLLITVGAASTTVPMIDIDAATADWVGGADTGCIDITCDGAVVADATLLRLASSGQPAAPNDGICIDVKESGAAQATSYAVRISSTNNEALHVDAGKVLVDEILTASEGLVTQVSTDDVADPPTQAQMVTAFGAAATKGAGWMGVINDAGGGANIFHVISDGSNYFYQKYTVGA